MRAGFLCFAGSIWMNKAQRHKGREWMCFCAGAIQSRWQLHSTRTPPFSHWAPLKGNADGREFLSPAWGLFFFLLFKLSFCHIQIGFRFKCKETLLAKLDWVWGSERERERERDSLLKCECKTGMLMHRYFHFKPADLASLLLSNCIGFSIDVNFKLAKNPIQ